MSKPEIVEVLPIQYQMGSKYPRIIIYDNVRFSKKLSQKAFDYIVEKERLQKKSKTIENPNHFIIYQYGKEPMLILDIESNKVYTNKTVIEHYGKRKVQQQLSILLRLLKKYNLASFKMKVLSSYRMGINLKKNIEIFEAYERLFNRKVRVEVE